MHTHSHKQAHLFEGLLLYHWYNWHVADIYYRHYSLWKRLLDSGNCTNLSENGDQGNKVKAEEVEVWSWIFSFSSVYVILVTISWTKWTY